MHQKLAVKAQESVQKAVCIMDLTISKKEQMKMDVMKTYACPMHAEVVSDKSGNCSVCNSELTPLKQEQMKMEVAGYKRPMFADVEVKGPVNARIVQ